MGGPMYYPRKHSGSMPAGQARPPRTRGETQSVQAMLIGIMGMMLTKRKMLVSTVPTHGAFLICMEMFGNGRRMLGEVTQRVPKPIRSTQVTRAPFEAFGEGVE